MVAVYLHIYRLSQILWDYMSNFIIIEDGDLVKLAMFCSFIRVKIPSEKFHFDLKSKIFGHYLLLPILHLPVAIFGRFY